MTALSFATLLLIIAGCFAGHAVVIDSPAVSHGLTKRVPRWRESIFGQEVLFCIETTAFKDYKVVYVANMHGKELNPSGPVDFFWINLRKKLEREEVGQLARSMAFGYIISPAASPGTYTLALNAVRSRKVLIHVDDLSGGPIATMLLRGRVAYLKSIFVHAKSSWVGWTVVYVDIIGTDAETGTQVIERLE